MIAPKEASKKAQKRFPGLRISGAFSYKNWYVFSFKDRSGKDDLLDAYAIVDSQTGRLVEENIWSMPDFFRQAKPIRV